MKTFLTTLIVSSIFVCGASAEFDTWTNKDGNTAKMKLVEVVKEGDKATGKFELQDGRSVSLEADSLSDKDAARLREWRPKPDTKSVFDEILDRNLVMLNGRRFSRYELEEKPEKFYVFYYTASWCPPCRTYTPDLVRFYKRAKKKGNNFEVILITSDRDKDAMLKYAIDAKMPWPLVDFSKARGVRTKLDHGVSGIPSVIVCDLEGKIISRDRNIANLERILTQ